jgi:hypothetical protein
MVGNDVVDLLDRDSDPSTLSPRFDERVLHADERRAIEADRVPTLRWRFWAAKEAAYKAVKQIHPETVFSPIRFRTEWDVPYRLGRVVSPTACCAVRVEQREGFVHAVARVIDGGTTSDATFAGVDGLDGVDGSDGGEGFVCGVHRVDTSDISGPSDTSNSSEAIARDPHALSRIVRTFACGQLASALGCDEGALEIRKRGRVPELWLHREHLPFDLSLSHHGAVVAFACARAAA